jgi:hypothetical protein
MEQVTAPGQENDEELTSSAVEMTSPVEDSKQQQQETDQHLPHQSPPSSPPHLPHHGTEDESSLPPSPKEQHVKVIVPKVTSKFTISSILGHDTCDDRTSSKASPITQAGGRTSGSTKRSSPSSERHISDSSSNSSGQNVTQDGVPGHMTSTEYTRQALAYQQRSMSAWYPWLAKAFASPTSAGTNILGTLPHTGVNNIVYGEYFLYIN